MMLGTAGEQEQWPYPAAGYTSPWDGCPSTLQSGHSLPFRNTTLTFSPDNRMLRVDEFFPLDPGSIPLWNDSPRNAGVGQYHHHRMVASVASASENSISGGGIHVCADCKRRFRTSERLEKHMLWHGLYPCNQLNPRTQRPCELGFRRQVDRSRHDNQVHMVKPLEAMAKLGGGCDAASVARRAGQGGG